MRRVSKVHLIPAGRLVSRLSALLQGCVAVQKIASGFGARLNKPPAKIWIATANCLRMACERTTQGRAGAPGLGTNWTRLPVECVCNLDSKTTRPTKVKTKSGQGEMKPPGQKNSGQNPAALGHTPEIALAFGGRRFLLKHKFRPKSCGAGQSVKMQS